MPRAGASGAASVGVGGRQRPIGGGGGHGDLLEGRKAAAQTRAEHTTSSRQSTSRRAARFPHRQARGPPSTPPRLDGAAVGIVVAEPAPQTHDGQRRQGSLDPPSALAVGVAHDGDDPPAVRTRRRRHGRRRRAGRCGRLGGDAGELAAGGCRVGASVRSVGSVKVSRPSVVAAPQLLHGRFAFGVGGANMQEKAGPPGFVKHPQEDTPHRASIARSAPLGAAAPLPEGGHSKGGPTPSSGAQVATA
jgi:hypothetical protein